MRLLVKSQLYTDQEAIKQGILDDCGPSAIACAVSWASKYELDITAAQGVAAKAKATKRVEKQGVSDNGSSLADLIKTAKVLGASARYATSWKDAIDAAKSGAALGVWVQAPIGYPKHARSKWHLRWERWWWVKQKQPTRTYGHMTTAAYDATDGWQWADPTQDERDPKERYAFNITEADLLAIAKGKPGQAHKHIIIITYKTRARVEAQPSPQAIAAEPGVQLTSASTTTARAVSLDERMDAKLEQKPEAQLTPAQVEMLVRNAFGVVINAAKATEKVGGTMARIKAAIVYIFKTTSVDEALLDAARSFLLVSISVALGLGIPILDISGGDFRVIVSAGIASALQTIVKFLDPDQSKFGISKR